MKKEQGITLIALIITIIILLLLAGVVINTLLGTGGIIGNADKSVGQYKNETNKEQEQLNELEKYINQYQNSTVKEEFEKDPDKYRHPEQSTDKKDIAISEDGESVNLNLWEYKLITNASTGESYYALVPEYSGNYYTGNPAYKGDYIGEGKINGKMPAYIYNVETGKVIEVKVLLGTFSGNYNTYLNYDLKIFPNIPSTITQIGDGTFHACTGLTSITIPSSVTSIGSFAFDNCRALKSVTIPSSVDTIGSNAFACCGELTSIIIPKSVKTIGSTVFPYCTKLEKIYCEAETKPDGWASNWNYDNVPVEWGYKPAETE